MIPQTQKGYIIYRTVCAESWDLRRSLAEFEMSWTLSRESYRGKVELSFSASLQPRLIYHDSKQIY